MATPRISSLSRTLFAATNKQTLTSFLFSRSFASSSTIGASSATAASSFSISSSLFRLRPVAAFGFHRISPAAASSGGFRAFSTRQSQASLNDNSPNWSNRPPKETILLDGCDFEHWLVVTEPPPEGATRDDIIDSYIKTLAQVVGSEEEARMKIYSVSTRCYFAFGALVSEELSYKLKELPNVRWVLPDSYLDVKNKDYGGEPFINGQAVPYDPKYHEEWIRNNQKAMERNRRNDRPRNADRSRNFDRRQRNQANMGGQPVGPPMPNQPGGAPNNAGYGQNMPTNNPSGYGQNMPPNNPGSYGQNMPPNNPGSYGQNMPPPNNSGFGQNMPPPNNPGYGQNRPPPNNPGYGQNIPPPNNPGYGQQMPPPNNPGYGQNMSPPNNPGYGGQGNPGYQNTMPNYQGGGMPYQNTQVPNQPSNNNGPQGNMGYQGQDVPGRQYQ